MKVDLPLLAPSDGLTGVAELARQAEETGFDGVSASEITSDPMLSLALAAGATQRIDLMTNLVVAFARSPMTLAVQAHSLQEFSGGRVLLGLGSQIKPHIERRFSMPWSSPAARMIEYVSAMRTIWSSWATGDKLDFRGDFYQHTLMTPMFTPVTGQPPPKVLIAAVGQRMTEAAGAVADGLLVHGFSTERYLREVTLPTVQRARQQAGRDGDFDIVWSAFVVTGRTDEDLAVARTTMRQRIAFYASTPAYRPVMALHGWGDLGDELNRLSKTGDPERWQAMGTLIEDDVLDAFAVTAEPSAVGEQLRERFGGLVTRYLATGAGSADPQVNLEVATGIKRALQG